MRGGGQHTDNKKSGKEASQKCAAERKSDNGTAIRERDKDAVIQMIEEEKEYREASEGVSGGSLK